MPVFLRRLEIRLLKYMHFSKPERCMEGSITCLERDSSRLTLRISSLAQRKTAENEIGQALQSSPGNNKVVINAVLTYEALGQRNKAIGVLPETTPEVLRELDRHPDLADFRQDPRFRQLVSTTARKGE